MKLQQCLLILIYWIFSKQSEASDGLKGIFETTGFHCYNRDSMKLPRHLHGKPQTTEPPFDLSIFDENGHKVNIYQPGKIYKIKLEAYIHFRGLMLQPRLCTPNGEIIGSLRGGKFLEEEDQYDTHGIGFHQCGRLVTNDSLTHTNDEKKFLAESKWTTSRDVGPVQFVATIATENVVYWEKWRPKSAFLKSPSMADIEPNASLFVYNLQKNNFKEEIVTKDPILPSHHPLFQEQQEFLKMKSEGTNKNVAEQTENTEDVFEIDKIIFEIPTAAEINNETSTNISVRELNTISHSSKFVNENEGAKETQFMIGRTFKKFAPLNDTELNVGDLKFLNSHSHLQHDFVDDNDVEIEEKCHGENPCRNDGRCTITKGKIKCQCTEKYTGEFCDEINKCFGNDCLNNSTCFNDKTSKIGYSCKCQNNTIGKFCEAECEANFCKNGGECYLKYNGNLGCKCVPGTTGRHCEREINECGWNKCENNSTCIDLFNDYRCECAEGWMGRNCDRPCQDIYGSCRIWKREGQCEEMRNATEFFDTNCAASCNVCKKVNETEHGYLPLQPILMPFAFLIGQWESEVKGWNNHTTDYPIDMDGMIYNETIIFSVASSLMFGTSYLNYSAVMISGEDPTNVHQYNGFLTIQQYKDPNQINEKGSLSSVSNTGLMMIEEGDLLDEKTSSDGSPTLMLTPTYIFYKNETKSAKKPEKMKRWFTKKNNKLMQYMIREFKGRTHKFTKFYKKTKEIPFI